MKKFIVTLKEDSELLESVMELLESHGIIEVEEVQKSPKKQIHTGGTKVVGVNVETGQEVEFNSITQASEFIGCYPSKIASYLDTREPFCGYVWYKVQKTTKIKI